MEHHIWFSLICSLICDQFNFIFCNCSVWIICFTTWLGIELILGTKVISADVGRKTLVTSIGETISYKTLIVATGARVCWDFVCGYQFMYNQPAIFRLNIYPMCLPENRFRTCYLVCLKCRPWSWKNLEWVALMLRTSVICAVLLDAGSGYSDLNTIIKR
jgi:hypothetical protein